MQHKSHTRACAHRDLGRRCLECLAVWISIVMQILIQVELEH